MSGTKTLSRTDPDFPNSPDSTFVKMTVDSVGGGASVSGGVVVRPKEPSGPPSGRYESVKSGNNFMAGLSARGIGLNGEKRAWGARGAGGYSNDSRLFPCFKLVVKVVESERAHVEIGVREGEGRAEPLGSDVVSLTLAERREA